MKLYGIILPFTFTVYCCIIPTFSNAMDATISIKTKHGQRQVSLDSLPSWFLKTEAKYSLDTTISKQALRILIARGEDISQNTPSTPSSCSLSQSTSSIVSLSDSQKNVPR